MSDLSSDKTIWNYRYVKRQLYTLRFTHPPMASFYSHHPPSHLSRICNENASIFFSSVNQSTSQPTIWYIGLLIQLKSRAKMHRNEKQIHIIYIIVININLSYGVFFFWWMFVWTVIKCLFHATDSYKVNLIPNKLLIFLKLLHSARLYRY